LNDVAKIYVCLAGNNSALGYWVSNSNSLHETKACAGLSPDAGWPMMSAAITLVGAGRRNSNCFLAHVKSTSSTFDAVVSGYETLFFRQILYVERRQVPHQLPIHLPASSNRCGDSILKKACEN